jgi:hypothetical protein
LQHQEATTLLITGKPYLDGGLLNWAKMEANWKSGTRRRIQTNGKREIVIYPEIKYDNTIPSQVGREIHRSRSWASKPKWWRRYIQECTNGLNDKPRSGGRPSSKLPEEIAFQLRKELRESKQAGLEYY